MQRHLLGQQRVREWTRADYAIIRSLIHCLASKKRFERMPIRARDNGVKPLADETPKADRNVTLIDFYSIELNARRSCLCSN